jgi:hypothetical protein
MSESTVLKRGDNRMYWSNVENIVQRTIKLNEHAYILLINCVYLTTNAQNTHIYL